MNSELSLLEYESTIRFGFFFSILILMRLWETLAPHRRLSAPRLMRWFSNIGLLIIGTAILRTVFPLAAVGIAVLAEDKQWGLFYALPLAYWQTIILSIICLDFVTYLHHALSHALPVLWRFHKVHHADIDFDVTTGLRFHPIEILLSMANKLIVVVLLGAPALAVLIFEVILNATSMFNHGNVRLPDQLERFLRWFVVTPDMHRIHHSAIPSETNSNFGFNIPWWDYVLGTYQDYPARGYQEMVIGLEEYQTDWRAGQLIWLLAFPFVGVSSRQVNPESGL